MSPDTARPLPSDDADPAPAIDRNPEPAADADVAAVSPEPAPPAKAPMSPQARSRLRRAITVGGTLLVLFILWETLTYFVAYTDDAYVRSDLVAVAPEITGPIIAVHVVDNQEIKKGDRLVSIDPVPFQLELNKRKAQVDEATSQLKVAREELGTSQAGLAKATSANTYAAQEQSRYSDLAKDNYAPRAELDRANNELRRTEAEMTIMQIAIAKAQTSIAVHQAALDLAKADLALAEWRLS